MTAEEVRAMRRDLYFDVWPDRSLDNIGEINRLHRAFRKYRRSTESFYHPELKAERDRWR